jgi:DNA-binding response OmpR family regulator
MRVLIVEDEPRLAATLARGLRENAYAVDVATDGKTALYQASVNPYDAIILDVGIPDPDGFEVCRRLRERGVRARILMLTARDAVEDRVRGLDTGADDYLTKPFDFGELLARMRALLRRGEEVAESGLRVADLVLDTRGRSAMRAGVPLELTTKEYALLEYFVRNPGKVIGRAEISDHVWDERYDPASNLIEVYINRLRRKVDQGFATPLIHTRRGAGYVLLVQDAIGKPQ